MYVDPNEISNRCKVKVRGILSQIQQVPAISGMELLIPTIYSLKCWLFSLDKLLPTIASEISRCKRKVERLMMRIVFSSTEARSFDWFRKVVLGRRNRVICLYKWCNGAPKDERFLGDMEFLFMLDYVKMLVVTPDIFQHANHARTGMVFSVAQCNLVAEQ